MAFTYQWYKNGVSLSGETNATLSRNNIGLSDFGVYAVDVYDTVTEQTRRFSKSVNRTPGKQVGKMQDWVLGNKSVARSIVSSTGVDRVLVMSDSTWTDQLQQYYTPFYRSSRVLAAGSVSSFNFNQTYYTRSNRIRGDASILGGNMNYSPFGRAYEFALNGGAVGASANIQANRIWNNQYYCYENHDEGNVFLNNNTNLRSYSWIREKVKTDGIRVKVYIYANPDGETQDIFFVQLNSSLTLIGESDPFNGYAATAGVRAVTVDVAADSELDFVNLEVCVRAIAGETTTSGKNLIVCGCTVESLAANTLGFISCSSGGESALSWNNSTHMGDDGYDAMGTLGITAAVIALGLNNTSDVNYATDLASIASKIRAGVGSDIPIIYVSQFPQSTDKSVAFDAMKTVALADDNGLFLDTNNGMPGYESLWQGFGNNFVSGNYYYQGWIVRDAADSSNLYVAKTSGTRTTAPNADSTNWAPVGVGAIAQSMSLGDLNTGIGGDGVHPNKSGYGVYAGTFWSMLEYAAATTA